MMHLGRRGLMAAGAGFVLAALTALAHAQGGSMGSIGAQIRAIAAAEADMQRLRAAALQITGANEDQGSRRAIVGEIDSLLIRLEAFQAERRAFLARLEGVLRLEEARLAAPGVDNSVLAEASRSARA